MRTGSKDKVKADPPTLKLRRDKKSETETRGQPPTREAMGAREDGGQRETWIALSSAEVILSG